MIIQQFYRCTSNTAINHLYRIRTVTVFSFLIFGNESHGIPREMVSEDQYILDAWGFVELHGHLDAGEVLMNKF